jgi:hypothetical protein
MKTLMFHAKEIRLTDACPVCPGYASKEHGFERTFYEIDCVAVAEIDLQP